MSKPGLYREASHSGSWYSASGNCQYSSVGVSMLYASCVIFVCFYFVFWLSLRYVDVLGCIALYSLRTLKQYPSKPLVAARSWDSHHQGFNADIHRCQKSAICVHLLLHPVPLGWRWSQTYPAIPPHNRQCKRLKTRTVFSSLTAMYEVCILLTWLTLQNFLACLLCC